MSFPLTTYRFSAQFDSDEFEQPYGEEATFTSRDFINEGYSASIDCVLGQKLGEMESQEFDWDAFFDEVINPDSSVMDEEAEIVFEQDLCYFSL